jgi:hypothetical protein
MGCEGPRLKQTRQSPEVIVCVSGGHGIALNWPMSCLLSRGAPSFLLTVQPARDGGACDTSFDVVTDATRKRLHRIIKMPAWSSPSLMKEP